MGEQTRMRFGPIRPTPPNLAAADELADQSWTSIRVGSDGAFPNGGLWRYDSPKRSLFVKRTGSAYLGTDPVWQLSTDEHDPQWWGREAAFYGSELARTGWDNRCGPPTCLALDARADEVDLWLEHVDAVPLPLNEYVRAVRGLARWQSSHTRSESEVLSNGWLAQHVARRQLDNASTIEHPAWAALLAAGLHRSAPDWAGHRIVDGPEAAIELAKLPHLPSHHDFHHMNIGSSGDRVVILDWATVGWGPVGHDVGNLVVDRAAAGDVDPWDLWSSLLESYGQELRAAGVDIDQAAVEHSAAFSVTIRMGWLLDYLLEGIQQDDGTLLQPILPTVNMLVALSENG